MTKSLVGTKINRLTIRYELEPIIYKIKTGPRAGKFIKTRRYSCLCDCGRETSSRHGDIIAGVAKSCGCLRRKDMSSHPIGRKAKGSSYLRYMHGYYHRNARKAGVQFMLTGEEFTACVTKPCHYCGQLPVEGKNQSTKRLKNVFYGTIAHNGIDRLVPALGYVLNNVVPCCKICNIAKHAMTEQEFYLWLRRAHAFTAGR